MDTRESAPEGGPQSRREEAGEAPPELAEQSQSKGAEELPPDVTHEVPPEDAGAPPSEVAAGLGDEAIREPATGRPRTRAEASRAACRGRGTSEE